MRPTDLSLLRSPTDVTLSPDGSLAVVAVSRPDLDDDRNQSELWAVPTDGAASPRRLTRGPKDALPRISPDGRQLAFLRAGEEDPPQLYLLPLDGGDARALTSHPLGVGEFAWRPEGAAIAYTARVPEPGRYGTGEDGERSDDAPKPGEEAPRRITGYRYRMDGIGFTLDRPSHLFVIDAGDEDAEPRQLTDGDADHANPAWSPDGAWLAVTAARHPGARDDVRSDVWRVSPEGGDPERLTDTSAPVATPAFSPDGQTVWYRSPGTDDVPGRTVGLWSVPAAGGPPQRRTDPQTVDTQNPGARAAQPLLVDDGGVTTVQLDRGRVPLCRFPADGGDPVEVIGGDRQVHGYARAGGTTVAVVTDAVSTGEIVVVRDGAERTLTDFGGELARAVSLRPMEELTTTADDGYPVHGWLVRPAGNGPFPVLLCVHGGPHAQYGHALFDEAQVYAAAGYAVVLGNPRGSAGYGQSHGRAVVGAFGDRDAADLLALLDAALADPDVDASRVGVLGGSYGGWMSAWLLARTDRFAAGVVERAVTAFDSFLGSSDIGWLFAPRYIGDDVETLRAQSPLTYADAVTAPTLIVHSEQDWRCPVEQAQRLYVALKRSGTPTELLLFPGEGHEMSRSGLPSHRVARFDAILDWFARHLPAPSPG